MGPVSASFDREGGPSQAPVADTINYGQVSLGRLRDLRNQRGYHKEDAEAALPTRLASLGEATKNMDTTTSVLGKRAWTTDETMDTGTVVEGNMEKRPRSEALEITLAVDLDLVKEHVR